MKQLTVPPDHFHYLATPRISLQTVAIVASLHVGLLALLVSLNIVPVPDAVRTLTVDIIQPAAPTMRTAPPEIVKPQPKPVEIKPQPRRQPTPVAQPVIAAPAESSAAAVENTVVRESQPAPAPVPAPAPIAVSQPRFDADYLSNPAPTYPPLSRRLGEEGKVILRVHVEPSGRPSQIELKTGSGSHRLDQAAQDAVWRWKFIPARRGDEAIAAWVLVPIVFKLST